MADRAQRIDALPQREPRGVTDTPIETSIPYKSRVKGARRHFGFFPFFAKKPWPVVQEYIKHYTQPGDLVCDPFAGSGVVPVEALVLGRRAISGDINPVARFITRMTAVAPVDIDALSAAYEQVRGEAQGQIEALDTYSDATVEALLRTLDYPRDTIPSTVRRAGIETVDQLHTPRQLAGLALLRDAIERIEDPLVRDLLRVALANTVRYCNRTYNLPYDKGERRSPYRGNADFLRRFSYSPASPRLFYEHRVWPTFEKATKAVFHAKQETNSLIDGRYTTDTFTLTGVPAGRIHEVTGEAQVDYCFTDPPYLNDIHFLDLSTLWAAWLRLEISSETREAELLLRGTRQPARDRFAQDFAEVAESIARALKPDRWLTLVYKHRDLSLWQAIVEACEDNGLRFVNAVWQDVRIRSTRQIESPDVNPKGDMYLNFRKMPQHRFELAYGQRSILQLPTRVNYVEHEVERLIVSYLGADIGLLTEGVVQQALNSRRLTDGQHPFRGLAADIGKVLDGPRFTHWQPAEGKSLWLVTPGTTLDSTLEATDRARYYVFEYLREHNEASEGAVRQHLLTRLAEDRDLDATSIDVAMLLRSVGQEVAPRRWRLDLDRLLDYKQLRLLFQPSHADDLRQRIEQRHVSSGVSPIRVDLEGLALLRDRLRGANTNNPHFETQYARLTEVLQAMLRRLESRFMDQIEHVAAVGDWARYGIDLRNLPCDDIVVLIVVRSPERPFSLYLEIADQVFADLGDEDILVQFRLETVTEWQSGAAAARQRTTELLDIPLLVRS